MLAHSWPGNVRELQNRLLQSVILSDNEQLEPEELGLPAQTLTPEEATPVEVEARRTQGSDATDLLPAALATPRDPWSALRAALRRQIDMAAESDPPLGLPLGRWLADDLVLEAGAAVDQVARRGCHFVGLPESTFRRRLKRATQQIQSGLAPRSGSWNEVQGILAKLVRSSERDQGRLLEQSQAVLLEEIVTRFPDDIRTGSLLLGVSPPTYRRRLKELRASSPPIDSSSSLQSEP
jgi:DNA-binding NtrC family response regulator